MAQMEEMPPSPEPGDWRQWFYLLTAALTCPCHLPIYLLILGGTSVGAVLQGNRELAFLTLTATFVLTLLQGLRLSNRTKPGSSDLPPS